MSRCVVLSTCGDVREAKRVARNLVEARLAACVNIMPVLSYYRWKGKVAVSREHLLIIKTRSEVLRRLESKILQLHSYGLPEIVSLKIDGGHKPYLDWMDGEVKR